MKNLSGKTALITGSSRGIGFEIAKRLAEEGTNLFLTARSEDDLQKVKEKLLPLGIRIETASAEIADQKSVQNMVATALSSFGKIDILINNSRVHKIRRFLDYSLDDFDHIIKVNLYGVFHVCQAVLPSMIKRGYGKVINIASTAGKGASKNQSAYNASKHAVVGLTRCLALEMGSYHINVNAICPGLIETDLGSTFFKDTAALNHLSEEEVKEQMINKTPINRLVRTNEVASMAAYLASSESNGITGQAISVCGGFQMI